LRYDVARVRTRVRDDRCAITDATIPLGAPSGAEAHPQRTFRKLRSEVMLPLGQLVVMNRRLGKATRAMLLAGRVDALADAVTVIGQLAQGEERCTAGRAASPRERTA